MSPKTAFKPDPNLDLVLERVVDVPPKLVWAAWTEPKHLVKWFTPAPWKTVEATVDLRPGGLFYTLMESPEGQKFPNHGCFLEIVPNQKLVWTDALTAGYRPSENPFFTGMILLEPKGKGTKYTAIGLHKDPASKEKHEKMGFHGGWSTALDQLVAHMKKSR